jgi:hypothetical protein
MLVREFRYLSIEDRAEIKYGGIDFAWSRPYEYCYALDTINKYLSSAKTVHNTSWGFEGVHNLFRETLDLSFEATHSDIRYSTHKNTKIWDITQQPEEADLQYYDIVMNISTVEEIPYSNHVEILKNLFKMVKPGGLLIVTMDIPGAQLDNISNWVNKLPEDSKPRLNGANSKVQNTKYTHLNAVGLVLQKELN